MKTTQSFAKDEAGPEHFKIGRLSSARTMSPDHQRAKGARASLRVPDVCLSEARGLEGELERRLILFTESFKHGRGGIPSVTSVH